MILFLLVSFIVFKGHATYLNVEVGLLQAPGDTGNGYANQISLGVAVPYVADFFGLEASVMQSFIDPKDTIGAVPITTATIYSTYWVESRSKKWLFMPKIGVMMPNLRTAIDPNTALRLAMAFDASYSIAKEYDLVLNYTDIGFGYSFFGLGLAIGF